MARISKNKFGAYIKKARTEKNISRAELASILNVTEDAVAKWETGKRYPDFEMVSDLSEALGVSVQDIYDNSKGEGDSKIIPIVISVVAIFIFAEACILGFLHRGKGREDNIIATSSTISENETATEPENQTSPAETSTEDTIIETTTQEVTETNAITVFDALLLEEGTFFYGNYSYSQDTRSYKEKSELNQFAEVNRSELGETNYAKLCDDIDAMPDDSSYYYLLLFDAPAEKVETELEVDGITNHITITHLLYEYDMTDMSRFWLQVGYGDIEISNENSGSRGSVQSEYINPDPFMLKDFYMAFPDWITKGAVEKDGIWFKDYLRKYIPSMKVVLYADRDLNGAREYCEIDDYYLIKATDRENWIYIEDPQGSGGWIYIEKQATRKVFVMTEDGMADMFEAFIFFHDGDIDENVGHIIKATGAERFERLLEDRNFAYVQYDTYDEMIDSLVGIGVASEEKLEEIRESYSSYQKLLSESMPDYQEGKYRLYVQRVKGRIMDSGGYYDERNERLVLITVIDDGEEDIYITLGEKFFGIPTYEYSYVYNAVP